MDEEFVNQEEGQVEDTEQEDYSGGEDELMKALRSLNDSEDEPEEDSKTDEEPVQNDSEEEESEEEPEQSEEEPLTEDEQKGQKREQSKEENARFAAQRRQKELEDRLKQEMEQSPEFRLAQQLQQQYGRSAEEIMEAMREEQLKQEAAQKNLPIELLRERQADRDRLQTLENELNQLRFQNWQNQITADTTRLKGQFSFLTDDDMQQATDYILNVAQNVNIPLEQALYAVHGAKIIEHLTNQKVQDNLAEQSGRKRKTPPSPNNGKPSETKSVTAEERYIAKQFGMSVDDYLKYKS